MGGVNSTVNSSITYTVYSLQYNRVYSVQYTVYSDRVKRRVVLFNAITSEIDIPFDLYDRPINPTALRPNTQTNPKTGTKLKDENLLKRIRWWKLLNLLEYIPIELMMWVFF